MKNQLSVYILSFILFASCNGSKQSSSTAASPGDTGSTSSTTASSSSSSTSTGTAPSMAPPPGPDSKKPEENMYRLIVSLISIGEGIDSEARSGIQRVTTAWKERTGKQVEPELIPWGREGEVDY